MKRLGLAAIVVFAMFTSIASADFYKYVDEQGNVRYTDDPTQVPVAQKDSAQKYPEAVSSEPPEAATDSASPSTVAGDTPEGAGGVQPVEQVEAPAEQVEAQAGTEAVPAPDDREKWRQQLENEKIRLDEAFRVLTAEIEAFQEEKTQARTRAQVNVYNQQVARLNQKIEAYEKRRRDLNTQIETFNSGFAKNEKTSE